MALNFQQNGSATLRRVLLVVLLAISLVLITVYAREGKGGPLHSAQQALAGIVTPIKFVGAAVDAGTSSVDTSIGNATADASTLSALRQSNEELRRRLAQADEYKQEAQRLEKLLKLKQSSNIDGVAARVVGRSSGAWSQTVTIDVGKGDGIESGMTVMGSAGVVGQIVSTTDHTSDVRLLTDPNSGAAAVIQSNRGEGIVHGSLEGLLYLEDVDEGKTPVVGDVILTSGLGGSYVRGLIIGTVVRVDQGKGNATGRIVVSPNDTMSSLEEVIVVKGLGSGDAADTAAPAGQQDGPAASDTGATNDAKGGGES